MNEVNIMNIGGIDHEIDDQRARDVIAHSENGLDPQSNLPISSRHYDVGDYVIGQDRLYYEVTAEINIGDVMAVGTNLRETIVSEELVRLKNQSALAVIATIAYNETGALATRTYTPGDFLYWDYGLSAGLYEVAAPINLNDPFAVNVNITPAQTLTTMIQGINNEISDIANILGAKNLLPNNAVSQIVNGVTFTVNSDGSVTVNGTATANTYLRITEGFDIAPGKYILSSSSNVETNVYALGSEIYQNNAWVNLEWGEGGTRNNEFTFENKSRIRVFLVILNGSTLNNAKLYPMIRPASIKDDTYVPYAATNRDLSLLNKYTSGTISGSYGFIIRWSKFGRVVQLQFENDTTNVPAQQSLIATLPSHLLPVQATYCITYRYNATKCTFSLSETSGRFSVYNDSGTSQHYISGCMTYIAKNY